MNSTICRECRLALRRGRAPIRAMGGGATQRPRRRVAAAVRDSTTKRTMTSSSAQHRRSSNPRAPEPAAALDPYAALSKPTWSVRSLLPPREAAAAPPSSAAEDGGRGTGTAAADAEPTVTPEQLRHLLRLSALPPPRTPEEEVEMLATLSSQLHFVRAIQRVDTSGVEPLRAIRDETALGLQEQTVGLAELREALEKEDVVGHARRPRRRRGEAVDTKGVEDWDVLGGASRTAGRYFVVGSGNRSLQ